MEIEKDDVILVYETMSHSYICTLDSVSETVRQMIQDCTFLFKLDRQAESADWLCMLFMDYC